MRVRLFWYVEVKVFVGTMYAAADYSLKILWWITIKSDFCPVYAKLWNYFNGFCFFPDTFQALIQYPDVVTAQAAKLVSSQYSGTGSAADIYYRLCVLLQ
jgi:hypothetical protein